MLHLKRVWRFWKVLPDPASSAETYDGLLEDDDALEDASEDRENIFSWGNGTLNRRFAGAEPGKGEEFVGSSILGEGRRAPLVTVGGVEARVGTDGDCVRDGFRTWSVLAVIRASLGVRCTLALPWDPSETYYRLFITYICGFSFKIMNYQYLWLEIWRNSTFTVTVATSRSNTSSATTWEGTTPPLQYFLVPAFGECPRCSHTSRHFPILKSFSFASTTTKFRNIRCKIPITR